MMVKMWFHLVPLFQSTAELLLRHWAASGKDRLGSHPIFTQQQRIATYWLLQCNCPLEDPLALAFPNGGSVSVVKTYENPPLS